MKNKIELIDIKNIKPYENNPRINDKAVDHVANSIKEFGFKSPIILDKNNVIICGHTRFKAAKKLKLKEVPCVIADDLTEEQVKAYRLADNKTSELSEWDYALLDIEINDLSDINLEDFGFDLSTDFNYDEDLEEDDYTQEEMENELNQVKESKKKTHVCPNCGCEFED